MKKEEFTYQRFNLRISLSLLVLPIVFVVQHMIYERLRMSDSLFLIMGALMAVLGAFIYYKWTENKALFLRKGYYWVENSIVFIQRGKQIRKIKNVDWINGAIISAYGVSAAMLVIQCGKRKSQIFSKSIEKGVSFSSTELYPIYKLILENNPKLEKDETSEYWYEIKREC